MNAHILHIGKTGGTAIRSALAKWTDKPLDLHLHTHRISLRDIPQGEKVVVFLRDPMTRFVSGFNSRKRKGAPKYYSEWSQEEACAFKIFNSAESIVDAASSADNPAHEQAIEGLKQIEHVRNRYTDWLISKEYIKSRVGDFLLIGFQETLSEDFKKLKLLLEIPDEIDLPSDLAESHRNVESSNIKFSGQQKSFLQKWLKSDYEILEEMKKVYEKISREDC